MTKTATIALATAAAALSAAASADAGFVYASALRSISLASPNGTSAASSSLFGDFLEFRSYSAPSVSGALQQASTLGADSMSFGAFAQLFSNSAAFGGPLNASSISSVIFAVDANLVATMSVGTTLQSAGVSSSTGVSVVLRDVLTGVVIYSTNANSADSLEVALVSGRSYQIDVSSAAAVASGIGSAFTNYSVSLTVVPAPGAVAVFGLAALGRRRRRN